LQIDNKNWSLKQEWALQDLHTFVFHRILPDNDRNSSTHFLITLIHHHADTVVPIE